MLRNVRGLDVYHSEAELSVNKKNGIATAEGFDSPYNGDLNVVNPGSCSMVNPEACNMVKPGVSNMLNPGIIPREKSHHPEISTW